MDEDLHNASVYVDRNGAGRIKVEQTKDIPTSIGLDLGEFLYQLRAALDGAVYAAAILDSGQDPPPNEKNLEFPICDSPTKFANASRKIEPLAEQRRAIIETVQPYNAPDLEPNQIPYNFNLALGILNDWARKDRHRRLHVVGSWGSQSSPKLRLPRGVTLKNLAVSTSGFLCDEREVATFQLSGWSGELKVEANPDLMIDIAVDEDPPPRSDNDTLGLRLKAMHKAVAWVVGGIEESFEHSSSALGGATGGRLPSRNTELDDTSLR